MKFPTTLPLAAAGAVALLAHAAPPAPTFNKDIAPLIYQNCTACHRPGEVAPFTLLTYNDVAKRSQTIAKVIEKRVMPPWKAEPGHQHYLDERRLTDAQIALFQQWVAGGLKEGDAADLPVPPKFSEGWALGEPDLILDPGEDYTLGAEGRDVYRCFVIPTQFAEERYVSAVEVRPGNRRVVHHVIVHLDTSGKARELDAKDPGPGYTTGGGVGFPSAGQLAGWAPGNLSRKLPDGLGSYVPKGADVVLQVHYHKSGKAETDRTKVGLYFTKGPVDKRFRSFMLASPGLRIPAGESNHTARAVIPIVTDVTLLRVMPHMHLLGHDMKITATFPDGTEQTLVNVPAWDFNWQITYALQEPIKLPRGSRVQLVAHFDNSENNPVNPSRPPRAAHWGEQTTDEMCLAFLYYTADAEHLTQGKTVESLRDRLRRAAKSDAGGK